MVRGCPIFLEYEGLHSICFKCGKFGYKKDQCIEFMEVGERTQEGEKVDSNVGAVAATSTPMQKDGRADVNGEKMETAGNQHVMVEGQNSGDVVHYGPWMIAKNYGRRRSRGNKEKQKTDSPTDKARKLHEIKNKGSRFAILNTKEKNNEVVGPSVEQDKG